MAPILGIYASQISGHLWAPTGAYDSIATTTVGAGGAASITFASIPQTYTHLQVRFIGRNNNTSGVSNAELSWQCNNDTGANYAKHRLFGTGSATGSSATTSSTYASSELGIIPTNSHTAGVYGVGVLDILDYANTSKYKTMRLLGGIDGNTGDTNSRIVLNSSLWQSTAAISELDFFLGAGGGDNFLQYSQIALFGIKGN
jgi:hypothetical protein